MIWNLKVEKFFAQIKRDQKKKFSALITEKQIQNFLSEIKHDSFLYLRSSFCQSSSSGSFGLLLLSVLGFFGYAGGQQIVDFFIFDRFFSYIRFFIKFKALK